MLRNGFILTSLTSIHYPFVRFWAINHQCEYHVVLAIYQQLEIKTFGLVLEFKMWRCGIYAEVAGLISCSFEVISSNLIRLAKGFLRLLNNFFQKIYSFMILAFRGKFLASNSLHNRCLVQVVESTNQACSSGSYFAIA